MEWQQLSMFAFHVIIASLEIYKQHEKSTVLAFAFLARAMRLPEAEFQEIPENMIDRACEILRESHEKAFGVTAGSYNYHLVGCHLKFMRETLGKFTDHNAYVFESSYGDL
jgi:hypothetical protein